MSYFNFPHTRTYDSDLGWLIKALREYLDKVNELVELNSLKIADPINWNITTQYPRYTIVINSDGMGYISRIPVPEGIALTNTTYWLPIFDFSTFYDKVDDLTAALNAAVTTLQSDIAAETDAREAADQTLQNVITAEAATREAADRLINTELTRIKSLLEINVKDFGAVGDNVTDDTDAINAAINAAIDIQSAMIYFPYGKYKITRPLDALENAFDRIYLMSLESAWIVSDYDGDQPLIHLKHGGTVYGLYLISTRSHTGSVIYGDRYNSLYVKDCTIYYGAYAVYLTTDTNFTSKSYLAIIDNCNIAEQSNSCIFAGHDGDGKGVADIYINNTHINGGNTAKGIFLNGVDGVYICNVDIIRGMNSLEINSYGDVTVKNRSIWVSNTLFDTPTQYGLYVVSPTPELIRHLSFTNCWCSNSQTAAGAFLDNIVDARFCNCIIHYNNQHGIELRNSKQIEFNGCSVKCNSRGTNDNISAAACENLILSNNFIGGIGDESFAGFEARRNINLYLVNNSIISTNIFLDSLESNDYGSGTGNLISNNIPVTP